MYNEARAPNGWVDYGRATPRVKTVQETRMLETEGNEENKEDTQRILVLVILVSMKEQVCPGVSGLLRCLRFLLFVDFLRCSIPHRPNILLDEPVRSAIFTQSLGSGLLIGEHRWVEGR